MLSLVTDNFEIITADVDERAAEIQMEEEGVPALKVSERLAQIRQWQFSRTFQTVRKIIR